MSETELVWLTDDYYTGPGFRSTSGLTLHDWMDLHEIPVSQLVRWEDAEAAYLNMQDEIRELLKTGRKVRTVKPFPGLPF